MCSYYYQNASYLQPETYLMSLNSYFARSFRNHLCANNFQVTFPVGPCWISPVEVTNGRSEGISIRDPEFLISGSNSLPLFLGSVSWVSLLISQLLRKQFHLSPSSCNTISSSFPNSPRDGSCHLQFLGYFTSTFHSSSFLTPLLPTSYIMPILLEISSLVSLFCNGTLRRTSYTLMQQILTKRVDSRVNRKRSKDNILLYYYVV